MIIFIILTFCVRSFDLMKSIGLKRNGYSETFLLSSLISTCSSKTSDFHKTVCHYIRSKRNPFVFSSCVPLLINTWNIPFNNYVKPIVCPH